MAIRVHARNTTLDDGFRELVVEKLGHAARVFEHQLGDIDVEVTEEHNPRIAAERFRLELTSSAAGHVIRVIAAAGTPETAVDLAEDRFNQQLRRLKERLIGRSRKSQPRETDPEEPVEASNEIVRIKQFVMKPMTVEEASLQMEMLGHDFYFFLNAATSRQCVLYRRRDGRLGLIEPV